MEGGIQQSHTHIALVVMDAEVGRFLCRRASLFLFLDDHVDNLVSGIEVDYCNCHYYCVRSEHFRNDYASLSFPR